MATLSEHNKENKRERKNTTLSDGVKEYMKEYAGDNLTRSLNLHSAWEKVCPSKSLEHTDNVVYSKQGEENTVLVFVDSSQQAMELTLQKEFLRIFMEKELNKQIQDLKFIVSHKAAFKNLFKPRKKDDEKAQANKKNKKGNKLTPDEERHAREMVAKIKNEKLRESLYNAIVKDFEWKKGN